MRESQIMPEGGGSTTLKITSKIENNEKENNCTKKFK